MISAPSRCLVTLAGLVFLSACGGGGEGSTPTPPPPPPPSGSDTLETVTVSGFPHAVDLYRPASFTRAIVFLHGGGGTKSQMAFSLGLNATQDPPTVGSINFAWLNAKGVLAVFPQGQNIASAPDGRTWSNRAMTSGVDDVAFLQSLAGYLRTRFGISKVSLAGHSMGGTMANRMWCESPATFNAYVSIAGPASSDYLDAATPCTGSGAPAPYLGIIGSSDTIMQNADWTAQTWRISPALTISPAFVNPRVIGEWVQLGTRASLRCGEAPVLAAKVQVGGVGTWSQCGGSVVQRLVDGADHGIGSIESVSGKPVRDEVAEFTAAF